jgi:hypothetical protein
VAVLTQHLFISFFFCFEIEMNNSWPKQTNWNKELTSTLSTRSWLTSKTIPEIWQFSEPGRSSSTAGQWWVCRSGKSEIIADVCRHFPSQTAVSLRAFFWHLCFALLYYLLKWGSARVRLLLLALCDFWEISGFISQSADRTCEGDNCFILWPLANWKIILMQ